MFENSAVLTVVNSNGLICINHSVCIVTRYDTNKHHDKPHHNFVFLEGMVAVDFVHFFPDIEAILQCSSII